MSVDAGKYLSEDKASRFGELEDKGILNLTKEESSEHAGLMFEIVEQMKALGEFDSPFEGKCRRCGAEYDSPVPEVTYPEGNHEIATTEWCDNCNALIMSVIFRESSAYRPTKLFDPLKGGRIHAD